MMKIYGSIQIVLLIATTLLLTLSNGQSPSVSLTVEGGADSLIGPQCPGTIRLLCEGTDLTFLQWSFNGTTVIGLFVPDDIPTIETNTNNPAFLSFELRSITRSGVYANYSSILTADLSLLQSENVVEIACAGPTTVDRIPVNVDVLHQSVPEIPSITSVTATYSSGVLTSVQVIWMKLNIPCPEFEESLFYEANITSVSTFRTNHTSCSLKEPTCSVIFSEGFTADVKVSISASNSAGSSGIAVYQQCIQLQSRGYFIPEVDADFSDCQIQGRCIRAGSPNTTCNVTYSADPQYIVSLGVISTVVNTTFEIPGLTRNTSYFLEFSVLQNESLQLVINDQVQISTDPECTTQFGSQSEVRVIVAAVIGSLAVVLIVCIIIITMVVVVQKAQRCQDYLVVGKHGQSSEFPGPSNVSKNEAQIELTDQASQLQLPDQVGSGNDQKVIAQNKPQGQESLDTANQHKGLCQVDMQNDLESQASSAGASASTSVDKVTTQLGSTEPNSVTKDDEEGSSISSIEDLGKAFLENQPEVFEEVGSSVDKPTTKKESESCSSDKTEHAENTAKLMKHQVLSSAATYKESEEQTNDKRVALSIDLVDDPKLRKIREEDEAKWGNWDNAKLPQTD